MHDGRERRKVESGSARAFPVGERGTDVDPNGFRAIGRERERTDAPGLAEFDGDDVDRDERGAEDVGQRQVIETEFEEQTFVVLQIFDVRESEFIERVDVFEDDESVFGVPRDFRADGDVERVVGAQGADRVDSGFRERGGSDEFAGGLVSEQGFGDVLYELILFAGKQRFVVERGFSGFFVRLFEFFGIGSVGALSLRVDGRGEDFVSTFEVFATEQDIVFDGAFFFEFGFVRVEVIEVVSGFDVAFGLIDSLFIGLRVPGKLEEFFPEDRPAFIVFAFVGEFRLVERASVFESVVVVPHKE